MELKKKFKTFIEEKKRYNNLVSKKNNPVSKTNGIFKRYKNPVLTAAHAPIHWRYDLNPKTNPFGMERIGINAAFNAGAIKLNDKFGRVSYIY